VLNPVVHFYKDLEIITKQLHMRATTALTVAIIATIIITRVGGLSCSGSGGEPSSVVQHQLGDTICNITLYERAGDLSFVSFLNLHANENTSVVAARSLIFLNGGRLVYLRHGNNSRLITFHMEGEEYTFDPNRMFTPTGIEKTLRDNGNYSDNASTAIQAFATKVLEVYQFDKQDTVVSIHNNGPRYSAESYLPNATFAEDAAEGKKKKKKKNIRHQLYLFGYSIVTIGHNILI